MCLLGFFAVGYTILERTKPLYTNTGYIGKLYKKHHASLATALNPEKEASASTGNVTTKILPIEGSSNSTSGNGIVQREQGDEAKGIEEEGKGDAIQHENRELTV